MERDLSLSRMAPWIMGGMDRGTWARQPSNPNLSLESSQIGINRGLSLPSLGQPDNFLSLGNLFSKPPGGTLGPLGASVGGANSRLAEYERAAKAARDAALAAAASAANSRPSSYDPNGRGDPAGWGGVNQWNQFIDDASGRTGIPADVIKAIMQIESGGDPNARSSQGYLGLMQIGPDSANANSIDWSRAYDPAYNILKGAEELALKRNAARSYFGREPTWSEVAGFYLGWGGSDALGTSTGNYMARFDANMRTLAAAPRSGGGALAGGGGFSGGTGLGRAFPNAPAITANFGVQSSNGLYGYGTSYGLNGSQHTGLDVMQPLKSPIHAPAGGQVICVGCYRNDHMTGGIGRIEVLMPDGAHVLFDHTFSSVVRVGDTVQAGQLLGYSGGMYSPHTHLEVRYPDRSTSTGFRLIDPLAYFGGAGSSSGVYSQGAQQAQQRIDQAGFGAPRLSMNYRPPSRVF
jgi:murein DD-endopeptidase MepM/ murein hydrolase activator NlpD